MGPDARLSLKIDEGEEFERTFTWKDGDGAARNLTGYTATFKVFPNGGGAAVISKTQANAITLGGAAGTIKVVLTAAETDALTANDPQEPFFYKLEVTFDGETFRIASGNLHVITSGDAAIGRKRIVETTTDILEVKHGIFPVTLGPGIEYTEAAADLAAPAANKARVYARDNGSGKTQLVVRMPTGAVQVIATEP